jgi:hypothetical protein
MGMTEHEGADDTISIYLFLNERMVKLVKRSRSEIVHSTYKDALLSKVGVETDNVVPRGALLQASSQWIHEEVTGHDLDGLTWILKMHADGSLMRRAAITTPTEGEISWTRDKFAAINKKGKCDMLKSLAVRTGCELAICNSNRRTRISIKGRVERAKLKYDTSRDLITVSVENDKAHGILTNRSPNILRRVETTYGGDDSTWIKSLGVRCIMHKSTDCDRLRRICRGNTNDTYPPVDVANVFEHLRGSLEVKPSGIPGAGDGLHIKGKLKKDQILGVYEGVVIAESEGDYILEIEKGRKGKIWVDADPRLEGLADRQE